jgi:parallel beta-helix repeat protein
MTTPNLNLTLPTGTDQINTDIQAIATNFTNIDNGFGNLSKKVWVSVTDYGADPTGTTASTSAFTSAINALPSNGGVVFVPRGTYLSDTLTTGTKNISFQGEAAGVSIIRRTSPTPVPMYNPLINAVGNSLNFLEFKNITLDGNQLKSIGVIAQTLKRLNIVDSEIINFGVPGYAAGNRDAVDGVICFNVENAFVIRSNLSNNERDGILGYPVKYLTVRDCTFKNNGRFPSANQQDDTATNNPVHTEYINNYVYQCGSGGFDSETAGTLTPVYVRFDGNRIIDCGNDDWGYNWGITIGVNAYGEITNNFISGHAKTSTDASYNDAIVCSQNKGNLLISGNRITNSGGHGIYLNTINNDAVVIDNILENNGKNGIFVYNSPNTVVTNNIIKGNQKEGIRLNLSSYSILSNNNIANNSQAGSALYSGVKSELSYNLTIKGNRIDGSLHNYGFELDNISYTSSMNLINNQITTYVTKWANFGGDTLGGSIINGKKVFKKSGSSPTTGTWNQGDYVENTTPSVVGTAPNQYSVKGWIRLTSGSNNVWGTDWWEDSAKASNRKSGNLLYNGDGTSTSKTISHGMGVTPKLFFVQAASPDAGTAGIKYIVADANFITVYFNTAPITGTNNVTLNWVAEA